MGGEGARPQQWWRMPTQRADRQPAGVAARRAAGPGQRWLLVGSAQPGPPRGVASPWSPAGCCCTLLTPRRLGCCPPRRCGCARQVECGARPAAPLTWPGAASPPIGCGSCCRRPSRGRGSPSAGGARGGSRGGRGSNTTLTGLGPPPVVRREWWPCAARSRPPAGCTQHSLRLALAAGPWAGETARGVSTLRGGELAGGRASRPPQRPTPPTFTAGHITGAYWCVSGDLHGRETGGVGGGRAAALSRPQDPGSGSGWYVGAALRPTCAARARDRAGTGTHLGRGSPAWCT